MSNFILLSHFKLFIKYLEQNIDEFNYQKIFYKVTKAHVYSKTHNVCLVHDLYSFFHFYS